MSDWVEDADPAKMFAAVSHSGSADGRRLISECHHRDPHPGDPSFLAGYLCHADPSGSATREDPLDSFGAAALPASAIGRVSLVASAGGESTAPASALLIGTGTFDSIAGLEAEEVVTSNDISIFGLNAPMEVVATSGTLVVNGVEAGPSATVTSEDSIALRITAPATWQTPATASLAIGPVSCSFQVSTRPEQVALADLVLSSQRTLSFWSIGTRVGLIFRFSAAVPLN